MLVIVPSVVGPTQLGTVNQILDEAPFVDGKLSAGMAARQVKNNEELDQKSAPFEQLNSLVLSNLLRHPVFRNAALPFLLRVCVLRTLIMHAWASTG